MMNPGCDEIRLELPLHARSGLEPSRAGAVESHLGRCAACLAELFELKRLEIVLDAHLPAMTPSPTFASSFANRLAAEVLAEEETSFGAGLLGGWIRPWLVPLAVGAALAIAVVQQSMVRDPERVPMAGLPAAPAQVAEPEARDVEPARELASVREGSSDDRSAAKPPDEVLDRLELFVDYAVIEQLDWHDATGHAG